MSIIRAHKIPYEFPDEVIKEAQSLPSSVSEKDTKQKGLKNTQDGN